VSRRLVVTPRALRNLKQIGDYPHGAYVVFYEVTDDAVLVRSIVHSATLK